MKITTGKNQDPERLTVYGPGGIGKTTFAANAPRPLFVDLEGGSAQLDVARVDLPSQPTWRALLDVIGEILAAPETSNYETLVIDSVDRAEWLSWQHVCLTGGRNGAAVTTIEDVGGGYGKGLVAVYEEWRRLFALLEHVSRTRRLRLIFLAHCKLETVQNPSGPDYQRTTMKVDRRLAGLLHEQCDATLHAAYEINVAQLKTDARPMASGTGARHLYPVEQPSFIAKNRYGLTERLDLSWDAFAAATAAARAPGFLQATIRAKIARLTDEPTRARATSALAAVGDDGAKLIELSGRITARLAQNEGASA